LKTKLLLAAGIILSLSSFAQTILNQYGRRTYECDTRLSVNVISRTARAVNYQHRGGATKVDFAGTDLMPRANGEAKVESKKGYIEIEVEFANLEKPTVFRQ